MEKQKMKEINDWPKNWDYHVINVISFYFCDKEIEEVYTDFIGREVSSALDVFNSSSMQDIVVRTILLYNNKMYLAEINLMQNTDIIESWITRISATKYSLGNLESSNFILIGHLIYELEESIAEYYDSKCPSDLIQKIEKFITIDADDDDDRGYDDDPSPNVPSPSDMLTIN